MNSDQLKTPQLQAAVADITATLRELTGPRAHGGGGERADDGAAAREGEWLQGLVGSMKPSTEWLEGIVDVVVDSRGGGQEGSDGQVDEATDGSGGEQGAAVGGGDV